MNDEETVALIAGGHTFGKTHGAGDPDLVGPEPEGCPVEHQGLGWKNALRHRQGRRHHHQRPRGRVDQRRRRSGTTASSTTCSATSGSSPTSPAGAKQWTPKDAAGADTVPDAHDPSKRHAPMMLTTDLALRIDPIYEPISRALPREPRPARRRVRQGLVQAAAPRHGPGLALPRPVGPGAAALAGPGPGGRPRAGRRRRHRRAQGARSSPPGLSVSQLVATAWASAASFRGTDKRGGANGARIRLAPQKDWEVNEPGRAGRGAADARGDPAGLQRRRRREGLARRPDRARRLRGGREGGQGRRPRRHGAVRARAAPTPRRSRPTSSRSRCSSRRADGFRNYLGAGEKLPPETLLLDRANLLTLTAPEMTVLVGGLRALGANARRLEPRRVHRPAGHADQRLLRQPARRRAPSGRRRPSDENVYEGRDRATGDVVDRHRRRPRLRLALAAAGARRGLRRRRRARRSSSATSSPRGTRS